jgi:hypothetical protein
MLLIVGAAGLDGRGVLLAGGLQPHGTDVEPSIDGRTESASSECGPIRQQSQRPAPRVRIELAVSPDAISA